MEEHTKIRLYLLCYDISSCHTRIMVKGTAWRYDEIYGFGGIYRDIYGIPCYESEKILSSPKETAVIQDSNCHINSRIFDLYSGNMYMCLSVCKDK